MMCTKGLPPRAHLSMTSLSLFSNSRGWARLAAHSSDRNPTRAHRFSLPAASSNSLRQSRTE
ncbi:unnamed protein product [Ixodes pacificus]